jgi:uncharacterized repeat protein (TIGR01451 family)
MFRKIVSNLAFSPALVGQLGFYAKRLKKEETTRRLGLVFTALALVVQSLTVFTPPESANAASGSDMVYGGIHSKKGILDEYDKHRSDFKDIMDYNGITRAELVAMTDSSINSKGQGTGAGSWKTWGRVHRFSPAQGEVKHTVPLDTGGATTIHSRPLWLFDSTSYTIPNGSTYDAFVGHSSKRGAFAIMKDCGNLVTKDSPKPDVGAHFIAASCEMIRGKAVDGRDKDARIKVLLYFGGPPGKGERSDTIMTDKDHAFALKVPEKYKTKAEATKVWGVMIPLAGWGDSTVQFENTVSIPGGCIKPEPKALCAQLNFERINRTDFKLQAKSVTEFGAKVSSYRFTVIDESKNVVLTKDVTSTDTRASSGKLSITEPGSYTARVTVKTSLGDKTNQNCIASFKVNDVLSPGVDIDKLVDGVNMKTVGIKTDFTYQLRVTNTGEVDLKNVAVTDTPPTGVTLVSSAVGTIKSNKWSHTIPSLKKGESLTIDIKARVNAYVSGNLVNTACVNAAEVNSGQPTQTDDCDDATVVVEQEVTTIEVCERATGKVVTIADKEFDTAKYSTVLDDCGKPCEQNSPDCVQITESKSGHNLTQDVDATTMKAQAGDRIEYTIYLENIGSVATTRTISEELSDVLEYAKLTQNGGGAYDETAKVLAWGDVTIKPGEKTSRSFVVQMLDAIPTTARGASEPSSYDCIMTNAFGNTVNIPVDCGSPKLVEGTVSELPKTGPGANLLFAGVIGSVVTFFWARARQLGREVKLIRKDFNMGTI